MHLDPFNIGIHCLIFSIFNGFFPKGLSSNVFWLLYGAVLSSQTTSDYEQ